MRDLAERLRDWSLAGCEHNIPMDGGRACWPCIRDRLTASTVVLDPNDVQTCARLKYALPMGAVSVSDVQDALRSLIPAVTPPEPNGLGAVVLPADSSQILQLQEGGWHIVMPVGGDVPTTYKADARDRVLSHGVGCSCGAPDCNGAAALTGEAP